MHVIGISVFPTSSLFHFWRYRKILRLCPLEILCGHLPCCNLGDMKEEVCVISRRKHLILWDWNYSPVFCHGIAYGNILVTKCLRMSNVQAQFTAPRESCAPTPDFECERNKPMLFVKALAICCYYLDILLCLLITRVLRASSE